MATIVKELGDLIEVIDCRNTCGNISNLKGISIDKCYIPSVANTIGTNLNNYKVIKKGQFACSLMQVSRDQRIPIAMYSENEPAIMSPAYVIFKVLKPNEILPEYMDLWFKRADFDREASFHAIGGVRGSLDWEDFCKMKIPVVPIDKQYEVVNLFKKAIVLIETNLNTISKLERVITASYIKISRKANGKKTLEEYCSICSGKTQNDKSRIANNDYKYPIAGASGVIGFAKNSNQTAPFLTVGRVGTFGVVNMYAEDAWAADNVLVAKTDYIETVNQILRKIDYEQIQKGGVQGLITQTDLKQVAVPSLDDDTILDFEKKSGKIRSYIQLLGRENITLRLLVDAISSSMNNKITEVA